MKQDEIIEMAKQAGAFGYAHDAGDAPHKWQFNNEQLEAFAKLVAAHAVDKDRKEFDIDELCARQNKIGYKQGYNAGVLAEREACAKVCEAREDDGGEWDIQQQCANAIRARGEA